VQDHRKIEKKKSNSTGAKRHLVNSETASSAFAAGSAGNSSIQSPTTEEASQERHAPEFKMLST
jgi:hypothetical protein